MAATAPVNHRVVVHSGMAPPLNKVLPPAPPLARSQTANSSSHSVHSQISSRDSGTTQGTSASALFPSPSPAPTSEPMTPPVRPTDNVMNKVAEKEQSLFQMCINLRQRMSALPDFDELITEEEQSADADDDPVTILWRTLRRGYPLLAIIRILFPDSIPGVEKSMDNFDDAGKKAKVMTLRCIQLVTGDQDLNIKAEQCFSVTDLFSDDTTGFVRVTRCIARLLDYMIERSMIEDTRRNSSEPVDGTAGGKRTQRQHIVAELVNTERTYVQQLELLQEFQTQCATYGAVQGDIVHEIFLNLNSLLDFQRRFLIRVEQINAQPETEQNWGKLFQLYSEAFGIYEPYITNQKQCEATIMREFDNLKKAGGSEELRGIVADPSTLYSFLMKPFQRLSKYPLVLNELYKKGDFDEDRKIDLLIGKDCATAVLERTNAAMEREERVLVAEDLVRRVDDWKTHKIESFGELLLHGTHTVLKSDLGPNAEREYLVFFFESIKLCAKEVDLSKAKNKMKVRSLVDKKGRPKLHLKGRIFLQNVTDVVSASKQGKVDKNRTIHDANSIGSHTIQVFWNGDNDVENFTMLFKDEEMMLKWYAALIEQKAVWDAWADDRRREMEQLRYRTSKTDFTSMRGQNIESPYRHLDDDTDDSDSRSSRNAFPAHYSSGWNQSQTSIRSRSTTNDSGRMPPPRSVPGVQNAAGLSIRTQQLPMSTVDHTMQSYFSPTDESPMSSRTSVASSMYTSPRQGHYSEGGYPPQGPYRSTSKEHMNQQGYPASARQTGRPTHQPSASAPSNGPTPRRNRSISSPSAHDQQQSGGRPPMPGIQRAQTGSPYIMSSGIEERLGMSPAMRFGGSNTSVNSYAASSRTGTPVQYLASPPLPPQQSPNMDLPPPGQLKVKVKARDAAQTLTLVVPSNITYEVLRDRIDAKLQRSTNISLVERGTAQIARLKYVDEEDYVNILNDDDVQSAFETWREQRGSGINGMGEIELHCF